MNFTFILPSKIIFGCNTLVQIPGELQRLGGKRILVVTSRGMTKREGLTELVCLLNYTGFELTIFNDIQSEPSMDDVNACYLRARQVRCDLVIGFGGGSVIDVAKKVAMEIKKPKVMIPTTAGTGSEVTHESVLKVDSKKKAFVDEGLLPDIAIIDPNLTMTMPPKLIASTGIDALAHAIECAESKSSNPLVRTLALEASDIIMANLRKAVAKETEAMVNMALGSLMAGMAFGNSGTTLCHALSYPLSNKGVPHGEAVAMMLPYALSFNEHDRYIIDEVQGVIDDVGLSTYPSFDCDIFEMAKVVFQDKRHLNNNPREVTLSNIYDIYARWQS